LRSSLGGFRARGTGQVVEQGRENGTPGEIGEKLPFGMLSE